MVLKRTRGIKEDQGRGVGDGGTVGCSVRGNVVASERVCAVCDSVHDIETLSVSFQFGTII